MKARNEAETRSSTTRSFQMNAKRSPKASDGIDPRPSPTDMGYLESSLGYALHRARLSVIAYINQAFGDQYQISMIEFLVLVVIDRNPGTRQSDLAGALKVERPRIVPTLNKLEKRGLAKRTVGAVDGRIRQIQITKRGQQLLRTLEKREQECQEEMLARLDRSEAKTILSSLWKLAEQEPITEG